MSVLAIVSEVATVVAKTAGKVAAKGPLHAKFAAGAKIIGAKLVGGLVAGTAGLMMLTASPTTHAADTQGAQHVTVTAAESAQCKADSASASASVTTKNGSSKDGSSSTSKTSKVDSYSADISSAAVSESAKLPSTKFDQDAQKLATVLDKAYPPAGAAIHIIDTIIQMTEPKPQTELDMENAVINNGRLALQASIGHGSDVTAQKMLPAVAALNKLSHVNPNLISTNLRPLVNQYQLATMASPEQAEAAFKGVATEYETILGQNLYDVTGAEKGTIAISLTKLQKISDPHAESQYRSAMQNFEKFLQVREDASADPKKPLAAAIAALDAADASATPFTSAKLVGGQHLLNVADALRGFRAAQATGDATKVAEYTQTIINEAYAAVQAQKPGKYTIAPIDSVGLAAAVAQAKAAEVVTPAATDTVTAPTADKAVAKGDDKASTSSSSAQNAGTQTTTVTATASAGKAAASAPPGKGKKPVKTTSPVKSDAQAKL